MRHVKDTVGRRFPLTEMENGKATMNLFLWKN